MRHTMVLILIAFIPAISFSKVYRRVELSPVHPGHEPFTGGFSGSRLNIIDFSDAGKEQIDKWFPVNKVAVFEVKNKNSEPIDLINLGSKEIKDIIKKIRVRKGSRASKISLLIDLEDLPYLSGVHQFIRQNKLESLFVVGGVSDTMIFDEVFWKNFKMFALLTQSIRRYVLIPASVDSDIRSRLCLLEADRSKNLQSFLVYSVYRAKYVRTRLPVVTDRRSDKHTYHFSAADRRTTCDAVEAYA